MKAIRIVLLCALYTSAQAPLSFLKPLPQQHLVNAKQAHINASTQLQQLSVNDIDDEQAIVFALQAAVASFLIDQGNINLYHTRIQKYFSPDILPIVEQITIPKNGKGICDEAIFFKQSFSAIANAPATLKKQQNTWHAEIPMVLSDQRTLSVMMTIKPTQDLKMPLIITQFDIKT
jgi:hypothetical protein